MMRTKRPANGAKLRTGRLSPLVFSQDEHSPDSPAKSGGQLEAEAGSVGASC